MVLAVPDLACDATAVAVPLRLLADRWIAYYWPLVAPDRPILQGPIAQRAGQTRQDISFRNELTRLYAAWEQFIGGAAQPSDGYLLVADLQIERRRAQYPRPLLEAYALPQPAAEAITSNAASLKRTRIAGWLGSSPAPG